VKFSFKSFAVGFGCAALSFGAVTFANAAGNGILKACANKKTGSMRYISKGSCKKTETSLSWNQMGLQGLPGATGIAGTDGTAGTKGDTGTAGINGDNGLDGKALQVVDATGKQVGLVVGGAEVAPRFLTLIDGRLWYLDSTRYWVQGSGYAGGLYYSDAACTMRLGIISSLAPPSSQLTFGNFENVDVPGDENTVYIASDIYAQKIDGIKPVFKGSTGGSCISQTLRQLQDDELSIATQGFVNLQRVVAPTYTAPLTVVAR
jgi:hypothetical protein